MLNNKLYRSKRDAGLHIFAALKEEKFSRIREIINVQMKYCSKSPVLPSSLSSLGIKQIYVLKKKLNVKGRGISFLNDVGVKRRQFLRVAKD